MAAAMAVTDGERALGTRDLVPSGLAAPATAAATSRARHEAEVAGCRPDLKFAVAAAADLGEQR